MGQWLPRPPAVALKSGPWPWLRSGEEEVAGVLPELTSRFSGSPLYQPTKARAENTPGSSSPGISRA